jgi:hypothetical protein
VSGAHAKQRSCVSGICPCRGKSAADSKVRTDQKSLGALLVVAKAVAPTSACEVSRFESSIALPARFCDVRGANVRADKSRVVGIRGFIADGVDYQAVVPFIADKSAHVHREPRRFVERRQGNGGWANFAERIIIIL